MALRPVVITGLGVICAAGRDPEEFWHRLATGQSGLTPVEDETFAVFEARYAGQVPDEWITGPPSEAGLDRTARLALVAARQALEQAALPPGGTDPGRFGIVLGKCQATPDAAGRYQPMHRTADVVAARVGSRGPRILISTACAAGGNVVGLAKDKIQRGEADVVLAGGVDPLLFGTYAGFAGLQALSTGPCRPYSHSDGLNLGEGAAFLLLEPLDAALARGATPLAEVAGYGLSADAYHATAPDPTGRGGISAVRRALAEAGLSTGQVGYVSGHGTGTPANDAMEAKVMRAVFGERAAQVPTSSIKSFVGHTLGAAGAVEAVASVLALRHGMVPPTLGFDDDAPAKDLDYVPNTARAVPLRAVVSNNYAFGGNNVSLVLTTPSAPREYDPWPERDVVISGLGPVTGLGVGVAGLTEAIAAGRHAIGVPPPLDTRTFAPRSLWRHMNHLSRMAIAASRLAWEDSGLKLPRAELDHVGLIFATASGSVESTGGYDESVAVNPTKPAVLSFSNVVLNATGGAVCQTLGLRGPTTTICGGGASASVALDCAVELIRVGKAEVVLVLAADETSALVPEGTVVSPYDAGPPGSGTGSYGGGPPGSDVGFHGGGPLGAPPGSAAVALVLESAEHCAARGGRPYARVAASSHAGAGGGDEAELLARALAGLPSQGAGLVVGNGGAEEAEVMLAGRHGGAEETEDVLAGRHGGAEEAEVVPAVRHGGPLISGNRRGGPLTSSTVLTGDCGAATGALNLAVAALAIRTGLAPALRGLAHPCAGDLDDYLTKPGLPVPPDRVLVLSAAPGSVRGAVLLEAP